MAEAAPRVLFVPVSGRFGMGEFARTATLAGAVLERWPGAQVHFVLSRAAPYARSVVFPTTWVEASATFHSREVVALLRAFRPHVVVFDNAGRSAQIAAARRLGAHVVFISSRRRQRARAFRWRWMRLLDEHWIAYPALFAGALSWLERTKLKLMGRPRVRFLDVLMARPAAGRAAALAAEFTLAGRFVLVVPGGGTDARDRRGASAVFEAAARRLAEDTDLRNAGVEVLLIGTAAAPHEHLRVAGVLPQADLAALLERAEVVLVNGGSTLLQALGRGAACVAAPISGDQPERIGRCAAAKVVRSVPLEAGPMADAVRALLLDPGARAQLRARVAGLALADGLAVALDAIGRYVEGARAPSQPAGR